MELTQEYFDDRFKNLYERMDDFATKKDLENLATKDQLKDLAIKVGLLATKTDLTELRQYVDDGFSAQHEYMEERFKYIVNLLDVRIAVQNLQLEVKNIKQSLHLN